MGLIHCGHIALYCTRVAHAVYSLYIVHVLDTQLRLVVHIYVVMYILYSTRASK